MAYMGWKMNPLTFWDLAYEPDHQVEPIPMLEFDDMADAKDGISWRGYVERNTEDKIGHTGCLVMGQNGLLTPTYDEKCEQPESAICEYRGMCI